CFIILVRLMIIFFCQCHHLSCYQLFHLIYAYANNSKMGQLRTAKFIETKKATKTPPFVYVAYAKNIYFLLTICSNDSYISGARRSSLAGLHCLFSHICSVYPEASNSPSGSLKYLYVEVLLMR